MSRNGSSWTVEATAVFVKEWRCELRTRYALSTLALFAVTTLVVVSVSLGPAGVGAEPGSPAAELLPVVLWLILLFAAAAGLPRTFVHEEETRSAIALRLSAAPSAVFCGKQAYQLVITAALELLVTPLFLTLLQLPVADPGLLVLALAAGGFGLATASTLIAAIIAQAQARGTLFAVLSFPVLLPLLLLAVDLTRLAVTGEPAGDSLRLLVLYDGAISVAALMLFSVVWNP